MALLQWTAAAVFALTAAASPQTQPNPTTPGVIEGTVLNSVTGAPIRDAEVRYGQNGKPGGGASSGEDGHFRLPDVPPGEYFLTVSVNNYLPRFLDHRIVVQPGQTLSGLTLRLIPLSSLSGQITDEDGRGLPNMEMRLWYVSYAAGIRELRTVNAWVHTDRQGAFRFPLAAPGRYYVSA